MDMTLKGILNCLDKFYWYEILFKMMNYAFCLNSVLWTGQELLDFSILPDPSDFLIHDLTMMLTLYDKNAFICGIQNPFLMWR